MRPRAWLTIGAFLLFSSGCGSSSDATTAPTCTTPDSCTDPPPGCGAGEIETSSGCAKVGWQGCTAIPGFVPDPTGFGCVDVSPPDDCAPGTMPTIGDTACKPVGTTSCAAGFAPDPSGWGCVATLPSSACTGATMEKLGSTSCIPVGDCNAAFPPAAATLFVSASGPSDATHFTTIGAALAAATDGTTIAVDTGTYQEDLSVAHAVTIAGKCPAQVSITAASPTAAGVAVNGAHAVKVSGVTLSGHLGGVTAAGGATIGLTSVVIDGNALAGVTATGAGTSIEIDDSVVRGSVASTSPVGSGDGVDIGAGAGVTMKRSAVVANTNAGIYATGAGSTLLFQDGVVTDTAVKSTGDYGVGIDIVTHAVASVERSFVARNHEAGLVAAAAGDLDVKQSLVTGNLPSSAGYGRGITNDGGSVTVEESTFTANVDVGIASQSGATLTAKNSVFRGQLPNADGSKGVGASASSGAQVSLDTCAMVGNSEEGVFADGTGSQLSMTRSITRDGVMLKGNVAGNGAVAQNGGHLVISASAIVANHESGLLLFDPSTKADVSGTIIARQLTSQNKQYGRGVVLQNGPTLVMAGSVIASNTDIGLSLRGTGTNATLSTTIIRDTDAQPLDGSHGRGVNVIEGATASLTDCEVYGNREVAALTSGAAAALTVKTSVIAGTKLDTKTDSAGRGFAVQNTASAQLDNSVVSDNFQVGVSAAGVGATLELTETLVDATKVASGDFGHGALANDGGAIVMTRSTVRNSASAGIVVGGASASLQACRILDNAVGINVQDGSTLVEGDAPVPPNQLEVDVSTDTVFDGNQTRVGSDELPLPNALN